MIPELRNIVIRYLKKYWGPEEISGKLRNRRMIIGKDSIYRFIYEKRPELVKYLRCQKGKYRRRRGTSLRIKRKKELEKKKNISLRPNVVNKKERIGDWEGDTVWGKNKTGNVLLTHLERKSVLVKIDLMRSRTAEERKGKTVDMFKSIPRSKRLTCITIMELRTQNMN